MPAVHPGAPCRLSWDEGSALNVAGRKQAFIQSRKKWFKKCLKSLMNAVRGEEVWMSRSRKVVELDNEGINGGGKGRILLFWTQEVEPFSLPVQGSPRAENEVGINI